MNNNGTILDIIRSTYYQLSPSEQKIASFVLNNADKVQFMSISELAKMSEVADATVTRFCRTLDLNGFNLFKLELAKCTAIRPKKKNYQSKNDEILDIGKQCVEEACQAINETAELIDPALILRAVELFEKADRVICAGVGGSMIMASECAHLFSTISARFTAVSDSHLQLAVAATMKSNDVLLVFSYSGATKSGIELLELSKRYGTKSVLVTRFQASPMAELANLTLCCGSKEGPYQMGSVAARVAQLVIIDILFREYRERNKEECEESIRRIAAALSDKHI